MTDESLNNLVSKKIREALGKSPHEPRRILLALLKAVQAALEKEQ